MKFFLNIEVEIPDHLIPPSVISERPEQPPYTAMDQLRGMLHWAAKNWVVRGAQHKGTLPQGPWRTIRHEAEPLQDAVKVTIKEVL